MAAISLFDDFYRSVFGPNSEFDAYRLLQAWGQRGDRWGWSYPSWIDDPTPVIETLQDYVRQPDRDLGAEMAAQVTVREQLIADARLQLRSHPAEVVQRFEFP